MRVSMTVVHGDGCANMSGFIGDAIQDCGADPPSYVFPLSSAQKGELIWPEMTKRANCGCSIRSAAAKEVFRNMAAFSF